MSLFALVACISFAVVFTEDIAAARLDHERMGMGTECPDSLRVKAAADFLDTLQLAVLFIFSSVFFMVFAQTWFIIEEFMPPRSTLVKLKVRQDT